MVGFRLAKDGLEDVRAVGYTDAQAPGAMPNGARVVKAKCEEGDAHEIGAEGKVIGSLAVPDDIDPNEAYGYFVEWDDMPEAPVFVRGSKLRPKMHHE